MDEQKEFAAQIMDALEKISVASGYSSVTEVPKEKIVAMAEDFLNGILNETFVRVYAAEFEDENAGIVKNIICLNSDHVAPLKKIFEEELDEDFRSRIPSELETSDVETYVRCFLGYDEETKDVLESTCESIVEDVKICANADGIVSEDTLVKILLCYSEEIGNIK